MAAVCSLQASTMTSEAVEKPGGHVAAARLLAAEPRHALPDNALCVARYPAHRPVHARHTDECFISYNSQWLD